MIDLVPFLNQPTAIVGTTGAGKTFAAKSAVERLLHEGRRVIIIDPTGAWYGLRAGADGKRSGGFPVVIFGGDHADVPMNKDAEAGRTLALALADREVQAIIDVSDMTGGEKNRFLTPFLEHLYAKNRAALHLVVDEADEIAAQQPADGEQRLLGAFDRIVRRGRIKGFRPLMISQRPAVIHKNVLSQIGTLIAMKLTSPQDRKAIEGWVKGNADADAAKVVMNSLPTLGRGEGWVWSPSAKVLERITFPPIITFDSSRTPEIGQSVTAPALTAVDVAGLAEALATAGAEQAGSPKTSRNRAGVDAAEKRGYARGRKDGYDAGLSDGRRRALDEVRSAIDRLSPEQAATSTPRAAKPADVPVMAVRKPSSPASQDSVGDPLLAAALQVWPAKMTWAGLAAMCGRKARGGHFNTRRKALIDGGLVVMEGDLVVPANPPATAMGAIPADLLEANLPQPAAKMFSAIRAAPGIAIADLASRLGMQPRGGHWNNGMAILRRNGLITDKGGLRIAVGLNGEGE